MVPRMDGALARLPLATAFTCLLLLLLLVLLLLLLVVMVVFSHCNPLRRK